MRIVLSVLIILAIITPVTKASDTIHLCGLNLNSQWQGYLVQAAAEFNRAVPTEVSGLRGCDTQIMVVPDIHAVCPDTNWACTYGSWRVYVSESTYGQLAELLHELMHAFGYHGHPCNGEDSAVYCQFDPNRSTLSEWDIQQLKALHNS